MGGRGASSTIITMGTGKDKKKHEQLQIYKKYIKQKVSYQHKIADMLIFFCGQVSYKF